MRHNTCLDTLIQKREAIKHWKLEPKLTVNRYVCIYPNDSKSWRSSNNLGEMYPKSTAFQKSKPKFSIFSFPETGSKSNKQQTRKKEMHILVVEQLIDKNSTIIKENPTSCA